MKSLGPMTTRITMMTAAAIATQPSAEMLMIPAILTSSLAGSMTHFSINGISVTVGFLMWHDRQILQNGDSHENLPCCIY
jgi:hypothetical protein